MPTTPGREHETARGARPRAPGPGPDTPERNGDEARRTSQLLHDLVAGDEPPRVDIGELEQALGRRAFGVLMLLFALPNLVPVMPPGISSVLSVPLILLSVQMLLGFRTPWFPAWLRRRSFARADLRRAVDRATPWLKRLERLLRPRLEALTSRAGERVIGAVCLLLSLVLMFPIPLGNWVPALAVCVLALALIERDGVACVAGLMAAAVGITIAATVVLAMFGVARFAVT